MNRYCAQYHRGYGFEVNREAPNLTLGTDWENPSIWGYPESHCAGVGEGWHLTVG